MLQVCEILQWKLFSCLSYELKLMKILSVTTLLYVIIYYGFMLLVLASFGHYQVYLNTSYLVMAKRG